MLHDESSFLVHVQRYADALEVVIELVLELLGSWLLLLDRLGSLEPWEETRQEIQKKSIRYVWAYARDKRGRHTLGWYRVA